MKHINKEQMTKLYGGNVLTAASCTYGLYTIAAGTAVLTGGAGLVFLGLVAASCTVTALD